MWGWMVGGNYVFTLMRAKPFLRRAIATPVTRPTDEIRSQRPDPIQERGRTTGFPPINWP
jgi:hypothetical protein